MGWAEKLNKNSTWYKKRHPIVPKIQVEKPPEIITHWKRKATFWNRLINEIKLWIRFFKGGK